MAAANHKSFVYYRRALKDFEVAKPGSIFFLLLLTFSGITGFSQTDRDNGEASQLKMNLLKASPAERPDTLIKLFAYYRLQDPVVAMEYAALALNEATQLGDSLNMVKAYNARAFIFKESNLYIKAIEDYKLALGIAERNGFENQVKFLLNNLAIVYRQIGAFDKSLDYHLRSLKIREEAVDLEGMAVAHLNIGILYNDLQDWSNNLSHLNQALSIGTKEEIPDIIRDVYLNLIYSYINLKNFKEAETYVKKALEFCQTNECDDKFLAQIYYNLGNIRFYDKSYEEAEHLIRKSMSFINPDEQSRIYSNAYFKLSSIKVALNQVDSGTYYNDKALEYANSSNYNTIKLEIFKSYADIFKQEGNYEQAYEYQKKYIELNDSIFSQEMAKNLANIQMEFQEELTQKIIAGKDEEIIRNKRINQLLALVVLLVTALLVIVFWNFRLKQVANRKLNEAKNVIEKQNQALTDLNNSLEQKVRDRTRLLHDTNLKLQKSNMELDNFIYKTSHDIKGPLATLQGMCMVALKDVKDELALNYLQKLSETANRLNTILAKLLVINQISNSMIIDNKINFEERIDKALEGLEKGIQAGGIHIKKNIDQKINFISDAYLIENIFRNLLDNGVKFSDEAKKESFIEILVKETNDNVAISVTDNGVGLNPEGIEKIFDLFSKGGEKAESIGLGLYLVKLSVDRLEGQVSAEVTPEGWSRFSIQLPKIRKEQPEKMVEDDVHRF